MHNVLKKYDLNEIEILEKWNEPHRHYHNANHLNKILYQIERIKSGLTLLEYEALVLSAYYHDIVYDTQSSTNEEDSVKYFQNQIGEKASQKLIDLVSNIIIDTKNHTQPASSILSQIFIKMDLYNFIWGELDDLLADEKAIRAEYHWVPLEVYRRERLKIVKSFTDFCLNLNKNSKILEYIQYLENEINN